MERNSIAGQTASLLNREIDDLHNRIDEQLEFLASPTISIKDYNLVMVSVQENQKIVKAKFALLEQIYKGAGIS